MEERITRIRELLVEFEKVVKSFAQVLETTIEALDLFTSTMEQDYGEED